MVQPESFYTSSTKNNTVWRCARMKEGGEVWAGAVNTGILTRKTSEGNYWNIRAFLYVGLYRFTSVGGEAPFSWEMCPTFKVEREHRQVLPASPISRVLSAQNNQYVKVTHFGIACSDPLQWGSISHGAGRTRCPALLPCNAPPPYILNPSPPAGL